MSKYRIQNLPLIKLTDLLKKRKSNLKMFLKNMGIATYTTLEQKCKKMGVSPPSEKDFKDALGEKISSPQEGIVVLDPPLLVKETGEKVHVDEFLGLKDLSENVLEESELDRQNLSDDSTKKKKKKKIKKDEEEIS